MIVLASDFGLNGPYTGQMKAVLLANAPGIPSVDLFADLPPANPRSSSYLLAAYTTHFPSGTVFLCIVDPGVGSSRRLVCANVGGSWFVGPDNGLFELLIRRQNTLPKTYEIIWRPQSISASFHGRDIFAPIAAKLAVGETPVADDKIFDTIEPESIRRRDWPDDLYEVIYIDDYGNAVTGVRAETLSAEEGLELGQLNVARGFTFSSVMKGELFCYENSNGLMEIAINQGHASSELGLRLGDPVARDIKF